MPRLGSPFAATVGLDMAVALHAEGFHFGGSLRADNTLCHQSNPPYSIFNSFHIDCRGRDRGLALGYQDENKIPPANNRGSVLRPCSVDVQNAHHHDKATRDFCERNSPVPGYSLKGLATALTNCLGTCPACPQSLLQRVQEGHCSSLSAALRSLDDGVRTSQP